MKILISAAKYADPSAYERAVERAGGEPSACYLPRSGVEFDGLILAGGGDIDPALYGQKNCGSESIDRNRDRVELDLLAEFARAGKPVLGICRGIQVINVWAGGGLIQDLGAQNAIHRHDGQDKCHLALAGRGFLRDLYGPRLRVNSAHHQGVGPVGRRLAVIARAADGIIEGLRHCDLPIFGVQFHPERMTGCGTAPGDRIFHWFCGL